MSQPAPARYGEVGWLLALARDIALIVFCVVYVINNV